MVMISLLPGVGRHFYVVARLQLMPYSETLPIRGIRVGCRSRTTPVQCRGARSLAYDLITGQGVVSSRAASILRSVETYPLIGRFVFAPTFICYSARCECTPHFPLGIWDDQFCFTTTLLCYSGRWVGWCGILADM